MNENQTTVTMIPVDLTNDSYDEDMFDELVRRLDKEGYLPCSDYKPEDVFSALALNVYIEEKTYRFCSSATILACWCNWQRRTVLPLEALAYFECLFVDFDELFFLNLTSSWPDWYLRICEKKKPRKGRVKHRLEDLVAMVRRTKKPKA